MMKSTSSPRRSSIVLASTTALLLAATPHYCDARNLRRSSSSTIPDTTADNAVVEQEGFDFASSNDSRMLHEEDEDGFESVGGPLNHVPSVVKYSADRWHRSMLIDEEEEEDEPKEYMNDESLAFVDPEESEHERFEKECNSDEKLWHFKFRTDRYGYETSWQLEKNDGSWQKITSGPPGVMKYHDNTVYEGATCLPGGFMYRLTVSDSYEDGFCCSYGKGYYFYEVGGIKEYDTDQARTFTDKGEHTFYVGMPIDNDNGNGLPEGRISVCDNNKQEIKIKILTDKYGAENSWELRSVSTNQVIRQKGLKSYGAFSTDVVAACVPHGEYTFTMTDGIGDGICCKQGKGRYEIYMDDELMIYGSDFNYGKSISHDIIVGYSTRYNQMSQREIQYLNAHNWRRQKYHVQFGETYVPLKYDLSLARHAKNWANDLLGACDTTGIIHEPGAEQGENLAKNTGNGKWGQLYPVENICRRWFEREEAWPYPDNAHFTQGLWRSARYVGCAESEKAMANGGTCRIQVCRYARAGNCNMGAYQSTKEDNWKKPMLMDDNPCGPVCPPNGCH